MPFSTSDAERLLRKLQTDPDPVIADIERMLRADAAGLDAGRLVYLGSPLSRNEIRAHLLILSPTSIFGQRDRIRVARDYLITAD